MTLAESVFVAEMIPKCWIAQAPGDVVRLTRTTQVRTVEVVRRVAGQVTVSYRWEQGGRTGGGDRWLSEWRRDCTDAEVMNKWFAENPRG